MLNHIEEHLTGRSPASIITMGFSLVIVVGLLDYSISPDVTLDLLYLFPIFITTWFANAKLGIVTAILATLAWTITQRINSPLVALYWVFVFWNSLIKFGFFLVVMLLLHSLKQQHVRLQQLVNQDPLTGISNSRVFYQSALIEISRCQRHAVPFSVAYIDVDNFKAVNDTQGHSQGDALLAEIADTIRNHTRNMDTVARLGGDEFAILLPQTNAEEAKAALHKIQTLLLGRVNNRWSVTFSIGVVTFFEPPVSVNNMIEQVDNVMYSVKKKGKNNLMFTLWPLLQEE